MELLFCLVFLSFVLLFRSTEEDKKTEKQKKEKEERKQKVAVISRCSVQADEMESIH